MTSEALIACLQSIRAPENIEEWIHTEPVFNQATPQVAALTGPQTGSDYDQGVKDVLAALGVLDAGTGAVTSPSAYYFVRSLLYAMRDGLNMPEIWQGEIADDCTGPGARLLRLLEETRLQCASTASPQRVVSAVTAVIKGQAGSGDVYLMQYDSKARQFQPLGGKRELYDANNVAALARELCEELGLENLVPGRDFQVHPIVEHVKMSEVSASLHVVTAYEHSMYHLTDIQFKISIDHITRWITAEEVSACKTYDGQAITALMDEYAPGILPTLGYSLTSPLP